MSKLLCLLSYGPPLDWKDSNLRYMNPNSIAFPDLATIHEGIGTRTQNLKIKSLLLFHLSYTPPTCPTRIELVLSMWKIDVLTTRRWALENDRNWTYFSLIYSKLHTHSATSSSSLAKNGFEPLTLGYEPNEFPFTLFRLETVRFAPTTPCLQYTRSPIWAMPPTKGFVTHPVSR